MSNQTKMATKEEARAFLLAFFEKMDIWDILFRDDRGKNLETLSALNLRPFQRKEVIRELEVEDYTDGPVPDTLYCGAEMWMFGKMIRKTEVYIKITMGFAGSSILCISFHCGERKLIYPFKA